MKRITREWLLLTVLTIICLLMAVIAFSQDSTKVKILKVKEGKVIMKTMERPRVKFKTVCECPYKRKEILFIKKPSL